MSGLSSLGMPVIFGDEIDEDRPGPSNAPDPHRMQIPQSPHHQGMFAPAPPLRGHDPSMGAMGAYYPARPSRPISPGAAIVATVNPVAGTAMGLGPMQVAGVGVGLIALTAVVYTAAMGGLGYWLGGKLAPDDDPTYKWAGAIGNVLAPGIGLGVVALIALAKKD